MWMWYDVWIYYAFWMFETTFFPCFMVHTHFVSCLTLFVAAGYWQMAINSSLAFLWERTRATWGKVYELHPWGWNPWCDNNRLVLDLLTSNWKKCFEDEVSRGHRHRKGLLQIISLLTCDAFNWNINLRVISFVHKLLFLTGDNGTIEGQGDVWWNMWRQRTLQFTRPNLVELMNSRNIIISNLIFKNSPFWNIHPVYCRYVAQPMYLRLSSFLVAACRGFLWCMKCLFFWSTATKRLYFSLFCEYMVRIIIKHIIWLNSRVEEVTPWPYLVHFPFHHCSCL